jgi:hypothetical protein
MNHSNFTLEQLTDSDGNFRFRQDPMINNIEITSSRKKHYRVFRNSTTQGKQAIMDYNTPQGAQSFADGCNGEHKSPTKMSAASLRNKAKEHLSDEEKAELEAIKNGEGI